MINKAYNHIIQYQKIYLNILAAMVVALVAYITSSSILVCCCCFAASIVSFFLEERKVLKHLDLLALILPFLFPIQKFAVILAVFICLLLKGRYLKTEHKEEWFGAVCLPIALYALIEFWQQNINGMARGFFRSQDILHYGHLYGLLIIISTITFLHLFFSKKISHYITLGVYGILGIVNCLVVAFTSQGLVPADFKIAKTGIACLTTQALKPSDICYLIIGLICLSLLCVVTHFAFKREDKDKRRIGSKATVLMLVLIVIGFSAASCSWFKNHLLLFNAHSKYGFITNFMVNIDHGIHFPEGVEEYITIDEDEEGDFKPNVIIVMNEAFSDLNGVFELEGKDNLSYFNSLREQYPSGIAYTSIKGNNTVSSEWECLSGTSTALTVKGSVVYQDNCIAMNSLVNVFNRRGYYTVGVHPYFEFGYNRNNMYQELGFQDAVFGEDFKNPETVRQFISDASNYQQIIELYEKNDDKPFFCFNVTMQNHGGYETASEDVVPFDTTPYEDVNRYLALVEQADQMLKTLVDYFEQVEEPTVILFFGDHQPAIDDAFYETYLNTKYSDLTTEQLQKVYQVPYLIWANYSLNHSEAPKETSINYLSSVLFDVGNIPSTSWLNTLREFRKEWPVVTTNFAEDVNGTVCRLDLVKDNEALKEYAMRSYAILKGVSHD